MKSPKRVNGAIRSLVALHAAHTGEPVTLQTLSQPGLSISYLEQLFAKLRAADLVVSQRGPGGGYCPSSENTTVGDVLRAFSPDGFLSDPVVLAALDGVRIVELREVSQ